MPPTHMEDCVETEELVAMLDGRLASDRLEEVLVHVDRCPLCAEVIASLARDSASRSVGRYQLGRVIGSGGMGVVHEGWDPELRRPVAVKLVRPERSDDASRARMLREARALARISHPNVVAVYDVGEHEGEIYVATELVDGETMVTWCDGRPARDILGAWLQAARGLDAAHAGGIVHRDVKPANVLVGRDGRVRIGDFGLARLGPIDRAPPTLVGEPDAGAHAASTPASAASPVSPARSAAPAGSTDSAFATVTEPGHIAGTPAYMAPEQWLGVDDARSDQYALSVAIIESLTGRRPGDAGAFVLPEGTPGGEAPAQVLDRALRADPAARFSSIGAFADALEAAIAPPVRRSRAAAIAAVALGALLVGTTVAWGVARRAEPACRVAALPAEVWSADRRAALDRKFPRVITAHAEAWMAAWSAAAVDTCAVDGGDPVLRDRRQRCLGDALDKARRMLAGWDADPKQEVYTAQLGIEQLPRPAGCSHGAAAAAIEPTLAQAFAIRPLRWRMDVAVQLTKKDALAVVREVAQTARTVGHMPFITETAIELAKQLAAQPDRAAASAVLRDAIARADQVRDDRSRAEATIAFLPLLDPERADDAATLAETARAGLARLGGDPALECDLDHALGGVLTTARRYDEAIATLDRARRSARDAYGTDTNHEAMVLIDLDTAYTRGDTSVASPGAKAARDSAVTILHTLISELPTQADATTLESTIETVEGAIAKHLVAPSSEEEAEARRTLGLAYFLAARHDQALDDFRRAAALFDHLKVRNSSAVDSHAYVALILLDRRELHEALREADRAADLATANAIKEDLGFALRVQGQVRIALGDIAGAREVLKHSLDLLVETRAGPTQLGNVQFQYARTLWRVNRRLAVDYATSARLQIQNYLDSEIPDMEKPYILPLQKRRLAEINRWLDEHKR